VLVSDCDPAIWPNVDPDDWCGEHEEADREPEEVFCTHKMAKGYACSHLGECGHLLPCPDHPEKPGAE